MLTAVHFNQSNPCRVRLEAVAERGPELCLCVGIVPSAEDGEHARAERQERQEELMRERTLWFVWTDFVRARVLIITWSRCFALYTHSGVGKT